MGLEKWGIEERGLEAETVVAPVDGVLHMYATLEEEENSLRAAGDAAMELETKIIIVAYDNSGAYVTEAEYEVRDASGGIKPTAANGRGIIITTAGDYTFIAYSLNTTSTFSYSGNMGPYSPDNSNHDPLWGSSGKVSVSAGMNRVTIEMRHIFSKVTVKATSGDLSGTPLISNVSAALLGYQAVIKNGVVGKGAALEQAFANFPATPATEAYSAQRVVYAGNEDITTIKINSATIGGTTHTGSVARFNTKLLPGRSYTLSVRFDELVWAGSNIHWHQTSDDSNNWYGYLDFDLAGSTGDQGFQGVGFKWGSLVGVPLSRDAGNSSTAFPIDASGRARAFVPIINPTASNRTWYVSKSTSYTTWKAATTSDTDNSSIIPYMDGRYVAANPGRNNTYLIDAERNTDAMHAQFRGDICQYIGKVRPTHKGYRLPTSSELGTTNTAGGLNATNPVAGGWTSHGTRVGGITYDDPLDGRTDFIKRGVCYIKNNAMEVTLPLSGYRAHTDGRLANAGFHGDYWSGSAAASPNAYFLYTNGSDIAPGNADNRSHCLSVRCVKN
jgi:hypothetical protein